MAIVLGIAVWMSLHLYAGRDRLAKEKLLQWELLTLRNQVTAFILEHRRRPQGLEQIANPHLKIDPFGNPYHYDEETGWVATTTEGYPNW